LTEGDAEAEKKARMEKRNLPAHSALPKENNKKRGVIEFTTRVWGGTLEGERYRVSISSKAASLLSSIRSRKKRDGDQANKKNKLVR